MIDRLASATFNQHTLAGLALGVVRDGELEHFTGLGLADAEAGRPVDRDTVFRIGSISKTMTAVAVMQLVEEGAIDLDTAVNDLGTRARVEAASPVTVRHLYLSALAGGGPPLLRPESLAQMLEPQGEPDPGMPSMGLAFFLGRARAHRVAAHDGGWNGFVSALAFAPDEGVGAIAFTNTSTAFAPHMLAERVLRELLDAPDDPAVVPQHPHAWPELTGLYKLERGPNTNFRWWPLIGAEVEITVRSGKLVARAPSPVSELRKGVPLLAVDPADPLRLEARVGDWVVPVVFERGPSGEVAALRAGSTRGGLLRLRRRPRAASLRLWARAGASAGALATGAAAWRRFR
jgi:CubicO group peptidase (beta-lactamase class C family)